MSKKNVNVGSDQRVHVTKDSVPLNVTAAAPPAPPVTDPNTGIVVAAPTVTIAYPAPNAVLAGSVTLDAVPHSAGTIASVRFVDGLATLGNATATIFGWTRTWDTTAVTDGTHVLTAIATDTLGQVGVFTIDVTVKNAVAPAGKVLVADKTDATEATSVINTWIAAHSSAGDTVLIPAGTYWVDGPVNVGNTRRLQAQDPLNKPVFHRHTAFPYRIKPDLRAGQATYNPNGRSSSWQYDLLGGQAAIPTSLGNPNATGSALGANFGGYDAKVTRSGTQVVGLTALYGTPWTQADVGAVVQYLVASTTPYQSTVKSVASDGKSLLFDTPTASLAGTHEGSEGTVAWCRHQSGAGWKVEHQTNDLLSFYIGPSANRPWSGYANALSAARDAQQQPIVQFTDTTACELDGLVLQHCNDGWHSSITNFEKSDPLITEFMRCVESQSANQIVRNCELHHAWGAGEHGPAQLLDTTIHHCGMQACTAHWDNKFIDGDTQNTGTSVAWHSTRHSIIDIEGQTHVFTNVKIQNLDVGNPTGGQAFIAVQSPMHGFTIKNVNSTTALVTAGTIPGVTDMWSGAGDVGFTVACTSVLIDGCEFDTPANGHIANPAITAPNVTGLTVTNNKIPTSAAFVKYGTSTNVTSTGNDGGNGAGSTTQKAQ